MQVGTCAEELAVCNADGVDTSANNFEEPLLEYVRILGSVKAALARREAKKQTYYNALIDLDAKLAAYNKALGVPGKEEAANQKQIKVEEAQSHLDRSKDEYEKVSRILMDEFEVFKATKAVELRNIALTFVKLQVSFYSFYPYSWIFYIFNIFSFRCDRERLPQNLRERGRISPKDWAHMPSFLPPLQLIGVEMLLVAVVALKATLLQVVQLEPDKPQTHLLLPILERKTTK